MKLFSKIYGDGQDHLIIIHGLFGMSDNWNTLGKRFSEYYTVHLVDLRNHGRSPHSDEFNYDLMSSDIMKYISDNNIKKPSILGHSLGGKVAMKVAIDHPNIIRKLIVADIAPKKYNTSFHQDLLLKISKINLNLYSKRNDVEKALSYSISDFNIRSFLLKNLYRNEFKNFSWRFNVESLLHHLHNIQDDSFVKGKCNVPTIFIRGGNSDYITKEDEVKIHQHFIDCSILTIKNAGHWLHAEQPTEFFQVVLNSLSAK